MLPFNHLSSGVIIFLPLLWLVLWLAAAIVVAAFSGLAVHSGGLGLFLAIFLGGGIGLPIVAGIGWMARRRWHNR